MVKLCKYYILIGWLLCGPISSQALNSVDIVTHTMNGVTQGNCMDWKITGVCFWLDCDPICSVNTTLKVDHFLPDLVVSVYGKLNENPWDEIRTTVDKAAYVAARPQTREMAGVDPGTGNQTVVQPQEHDNHFKEVDIIGNPALWFFKRLEHIYLPSQATPLMPYYVSLADAYIWRSPLLEIALHPSGLVPGYRIVGSLLNNWGSIFPRNGFIQQPADAKAAALIAQRAADIVTAQNTSAAPHLVKTLSSTSCGDHCTVEDSRENDMGSMRWQMIYPTNQKQCSIFGTQDFPGQPWGQADFKKGQGNYTWILWRHYHGCIPGEGKYIGST